MATPDEEASMTQKRLSIGSIDCSYSVERRRSNVTTEQQHCHQGPVPPLSAREIVASRTFRSRQVNHLQPCSGFTPSTPSLDAVCCHKQRQLEIRGLAGTLECMLGAVGGYGYAALLGQRPSLSNTEALRAFVETHIGEDGELPDLVTLSRQVRRALDRAEQARDDI